MNKLLEYGRKVMFLFRVLSGYEERRIRAFRLELQRQLDESQRKKEALRKAPEQFILGEVRRMVEEMRNLNKKLNETEAAIDEYFKPLDKKAEMIMKMRLEREGDTMKEMMKIVQSEALAQNHTTKEMMMKTMQSEALDEKAELNKIPDASNTDPGKQDDSASTKTHQT